MTRSYMQVKHCLADMGLRLFPKAPVEIRA